MTEEQLRMPLDQNHCGSSRHPGSYFSLCSRWLNAGSFCFLVTLDDPLQRNVQLLQVIDVLFYRGKFLHDLLWCIAVLEGMKLNLLVAFLGLFFSMLLWKTRSRPNEATGKAAAHRRHFCGNLCLQLPQANVQTTGWDAKCPHVGLIIYIISISNLKENFWQELNICDIVLSVGIIESIT